MNWPLAVTELRKTGIDGSSVAADGTDEAQVTALAGTAVDRLSSVDILVNNAGITETHPPKSIRPTPGTR